MPVLFVSINSRPQGVGTMRTLHVLVNESKVSINSRPQRVGTMILAMATTEVLMFPLIHVPSEWGLTLLSFW